MSRRPDLALGLAAALAVSPVAVAVEPAVKVGRYSTVQPVARSHRAHLLAIVVEVSFPELGVQTAGDAMEYLLARSGYRLASPKAFDPAMASLLSLPVPEAHRELGPVTLEQGLQTLAGQAYSLVVDHVHRLVSFELLTRYQTVRSAPRRVGPMPSDSVGSVAVAKATPGSSELNEPVADGLLTLRR